MSIVAPISHVYDCRNTWCCLGDEFPPPMGCARRAREGGRRLVMESETVEKFGRPIRYSRIAEELESVNVDADGDPLFTQWLRTPSVGPWMRSEAAAIDRFAADHPAAVRAIVAAAIVR